MSDPRDPIRWTETDPRLGTKPLTILAVAALVAFGIFGVLAGALGW